MSSVNSSLFVYKNDGKLILILVYVHDTLITRNDNTQLQRVILDLNKKFALKTLRVVNYFLGFEIQRKEGTLLLTQSKYASNLLKKCNMLKAKKTETPMVASLKLAANDGKVIEHI